VKGTKVQYISDVLQMTLLPCPLPDDDVGFCSDILLSLETRDDITAQVLVHASVDKAVLCVGNTTAKGSPMADFATRAKALQKHWQELDKRFRDSTDPYDVTADAAYPPLMTTMPEGKPPSWKLELDEHRAEEARRLYAAFKARRLNALSYFRIHRPRPMGWAPVNGDAWRETERSKIESGELYHSKSWTPMYMSWNLQSFDVPYDWKDPSADESILREREEEQSFFSTWIRRMNQMRNVRQDWEKNQNSRVGYD
jgi:hypothetical protein